jgi:6-pyruvoyltetrahydropterin/6-carboxytetrahydropterin synthase
MLIRKLFKFENAHIVRNCSTDRCKFSIHGHSYKVEVIFSSNHLDNGQMVYDFGLVKGAIHRIIDAFDHAITLWSADDAEYVEYAKKFSKRWVELPVSPSAEQFSRVFFLLIDEALKNANFANGEKNVELHSVIVHETDTGYAQCFAQDAYSQLMGVIDTGKIIFSDEIKKEF